MPTIPEVTLLVVSIFTTATAIAQSAAPQPVPARAGVNTLPEDEIKALELKLADLIVHGDWDEYEKRLMPDFTRITYDGKQPENKEATMSSLRSGPRKIVVMEPEDLRVHTYGETAILQGKVTISVRESGRLSTKIERFTEVFVKQDGQWYLAAEQETLLGK